MNDLPKVLESKVKIRFQDCDPFNHLNNAAYINYFVNAREDQLIKNYQLDIYDLAKTKGISWVTASNQIVYLKPAFLNEWVCIESQIIKYNTSSLQVELRMWNTNKTELKAILWGTFVHFNLKTQKAETHSLDLTNLFKKVIHPIKENNFEERIQFFRNKKTILQNN